MIRHQIVHFGPGSCQRRGLVASHLTVLRRRLCLEQNIDDAV